MAYLQEAPEIRVVIELILDPLLRHRQMTDEDRACQSELESSIQEYVTNAMDYRCVLSLSPSTWRA